MDHWADTEPMPKQFKTTNVHKAEPVGFAVEPEVKFTIKDSGERKVFDSGMLRDTTGGKIQYGRVLDGPMFKRWAEHLTKGAVKYPDVAPGCPNWMLANSLPEIERFRDSALRHFISWWNGEVDEDHAAGVLFNINGAEYTRARLGVMETPEDDHEDPTVFYPPNGFPDLWMHGV